MSNVVARRYGKALLELGVESGNLDSMVREIDAAASTYASSEELRDALDNPLIDHTAKHGIVSDIADRLGLGQLAKNTLKLLVDRRRIKFLPAISAELRTQADVKKGLVRAEVTSATPLSEDYYGKLAQQLERMTGHKVALDKKIDPSLLGGVITRIGDMIYDGSLRTRLESLKTALSN